MFTTRDLIMFLAGAFFLHTVSHLMFPYIVNLPADFNLAFLTPAMQIVWTPLLNWSVVIISALITIVLLIWARRLK